MHNPTDRVMQKVYEEALKALQTIKRNKQLVLFTDELTWKEIDVKQGTKTS